MPAIAAGPEIERLIQLLARLPGLGPRSARRAALFLIKKREAVMAPLASALQVAIRAEVPVATLGNMPYAYPTFHRAIEDALKNLTRAERLRPS